MTIKTAEALVLVSKQNGVTVIPEATPLTRLNYFDGKFLRASDLKAEQDYLRNLVRLSNQAGGPGVAYGFDLTLGSGDTLVIGQGLAIDSAGRVLLLPEVQTQGIQDIIERSRDLQRLSSKASVLRAGTFERCEVVKETSVGITPASNVYLIVISSAEALCGEEDVFGKLCEEACATSTDRPLVVEGLVVRAIPLQLHTPLPTSKAVALTQVHLRSRIASAFFEEERQLVGSLISKFGLEQDTWCLGADAAVGNGVPIGVIARAGTSTSFLDAWTARRERIDAPARRYWQWRMMMRPWDVFIAQILQFQCQLHEVLKKVPGPGTDVDPCGGARVALDEARTAIDELRQFYEVTTARFRTLANEGITIRGGVSRITDLNKKLVTIAAGLSLVPQDRLLIRGGIIELPSAGYLPVSPGAAATINQQVRQLLGEGVDLRFCVVRPDFVAHAVEEAQHMERISLTQGLDDPNNKPQVDILVPNGKILEKKDLSPGQIFEATVSVDEGLFGVAPNRLALLARQSVNLSGAARTETSASGGGAVYVASEFQANRIDLPTTNTLSSGVLSSLSGRLTTTTPRVGLWSSLACERNVFSLQLGDSTNFNARAIMASSTAQTVVCDISCNGVLQIIEAPRTLGNKQTVRGHVENAQLTVVGQLFGNAGDKTTHLIDFDVFVTLTNKSEIEIQIDHAKNDFVLTASWAEQPLKVSASISSKGTNTAGQPTDRQLLEASLKQNTDVLLKDNASHVLALDALDVIAAVLKNPTFTDASTRLLFPPPSKPTEELQVQGTLDWVLFHRRRTKTCSEEKIAPPVLLTRHYELFEVQADGIPDAKQLITAIRAGEAPVSRLKAVGMVEFAGGVATLLTSSTDLLKDWQNASPGNTIVYGGIANRETAAGDGEPLSRQRIDRIESVVDSISKIVPDAQNEVLAKMPVPVSAPGADGAIVIVTLNQSTKTCHSVFRVASVEGLKRIMDLIRNDPNNGMRTAITEFSKSIGDVNFITDKAELFNDDTMPKAIDRWKAEGDGQAAESLVVTRAGDTTIPQDLAIKQASTINSSLGAAATAPSPRFLQSASAFPDTIKCPAITFVVGLAQRLALVVFTQPVTGAAGVRKVADGSRQTKVVFIDNEPQGTALNDSFAGIPPGVGLARTTRVRLADIEGPLDPTAQARLNKVVTTLQTAAGGLPNLASSALVLTQADKTMLANQNVAISGFDEVIFLDLFPG